MNKMNYILIIAVLIVGLGVGAYFFLQTKETKIGGEITRAQAEAIFQKYLESRQDEFILFETNEIPEGWAFKYTTKDMMSNEKRYMPPGEYPFIVKKDGSTEQQDGRPVN
jgi:hypothetical protein